MSEPLPTDIRQRVVEDFGEEQADEIYAHLLAKIPSLPNGTRPRHLRCILFLANGDTQQLNHYIAMCLRDTRDVMLHAEYETNAEGEMVRKYDFNRPFSDAQRDTS